jgi:tyrosyl-tRNA synthetase
MEKKMDIEEQVAILMQGTEYGDDSLKNAMTNELKERLVEANQENRPLRVYCGYDPRTTDLHLGHTVTMRKLRQFQDLGHDVTFLIGNYTSLIGDPSDQDKLRPQLTPEQVAKNGLTYAQQAFRILDPEKTKVQYNAKWLSEISFAELIKLASNFTVQQFLTRENFRLRWDHGDAIYLHETFYSIMQGYDAYALKADVQVGGTDQLFNIITAARKVMTYLGSKPNIGIILGILPGTDGVIKMSKSLGNHIPISSTPEDMFGKVMSIPDNAMDYYFKLVTRWSPTEIDIIEKQLADGSLHPRDIKQKLSHEIVSSLFGEDAALEAEDNFIRLFQHHDVPVDMPEYQIKPNQSVLDVLLSSGMVASRNEGRRLLDQKGIRFEGNIVTDPQTIISNEGVLQAGKRKYIRLKP